MRRAFLLLGLWIALGLHPWTVMTGPPDNRSQTVTARPILLDPARPTLRQVGAFRMTEGWELRSPHSRFGGLSALVLAGPRRFVTVSDFGMVAGLTLARDGAVSDAFIRRLPGVPNEQAFKKERDVEAMAVDPASGRLWIGFEYRQQIWRYTPDFAGLDGRAAPPAMAAWQANGGAEAMARLPDGRFLVMGEEGDDDHGWSPGLLFAGDPVAGGGADPLRFAYDPQDFGKVTDAAALPDGRVLLLHRTFSLFSGFRSVIAIADPATIRADRPWRARALARFAPPLLTENFEGIAVEPDPDGVGVWLLSDDNMVTWQRTLLIRLLLPHAALGESRTDSGR